MKLPLVGKVTGVRRDETSLLIELQVVDKDGTSVGYHPLTMGPKTSVSGAVAAVQQHVNQLAASALKKGEAETETEEINEEGDQALVGREFLGSVSQ